jgi:hypothetical protein
MAALSLEHFAATGTINSEEFAKRVSAYEAAVGDLETIVILLARWSNSEHLLFLRKNFARLAELDKGNGGTVVWLRLGWYLLLVLMYAGGMRLCLHGVTMRCMLSWPHPCELTRRYPALTKEPSFFRSLPPQIAETFKLLPGHDRDQVPRSEHLFARLRPVLDDALYLGESYETLFDRVELFWR